jgi:hypothetical protein
MLEALISKFAQIEDPRCDWRVEHKLLDILVIAVCAVIGEAEGFEDIALPGYPFHSSFDDDPIRMGRRSCAGIGEPLG